MARQVPNRHRATPYQRHVWATGLSVALLVGSTAAINAQNPPGQRQGVTPAPRTPAVAKPIPPEEIFRRFSGRVVLLTCESGLGSGVLVSSDGLIVTNAHVVEGCQTMMATRTSGGTRRSFKAGLKYYDRPTDTAVLKIEAVGLDHFELGPWVEYQQLRVGSRVYAIGNPLGLENTITEGILSGERDCFGVPCLQHSAAISPGNSGGALISAEGNLLGINYFLLSGSQNLNFAVPASTLMNAISIARARSGYLRFPPEPRSAPPVSAVPSPPADTLGAFSKRDYLRAIQLGKQNVAAGVDSGRNYALVGSSYCELGMYSDAEPFITQAFILLRTEDSYVQTAIHCRLSILVERFRQGETMLRAEIATSATRFLASSQPILLGSDADARRSVKEVLAGLQLLSGEWLDENDIFCRSVCLKGPKGTVRIKAPDGVGSYWADASNERKDSTEARYQNGFAYVQLRPEGDHYRGDNFSVGVSWEDVARFVAITQQGILNLRLSPDTTTLSGEITFGPPAVKAEDKEPPCQGCISAKQQGEFESALLTEFGSIPVRLVRR